MASCTYIRECTERYIYLRPWEWCFKSCRYKLSRSDPRIFPYQWPLLLLYFLLAAPCSCCYTFVCPETLVASLRPTTEPRPVHKKIYLRSSAIPTKNLLPDLFYTPVLLYTTLHPSIYPYVVVVRESRHKGTNIKRIVLHLFTQLFEL